MPLQPLEMYKSIFENAVEGIFQTTADGHYLNVNPALATLYGYGSPEELIDALTSIETQLYIEKARRKEFILEMGENGFVKDFESEIYRKDKSTIWISENVRSVKNDNGGLLYYEGFVVDITERKSAELFLRNSVRELDKRVDDKTLQLRELEKCLRIIINSIEDSVVLLDQSGYVLIANESSGKRYGVDPKDLIGKRLEEFMPEESALKHRTRHENVMKTIATARWEDEFSGLVFETKVIPIVNNDGVPFRLAVISKDVTYEREMEDMISENNSDIL